MASLDTMLQERARRIQQMIRQQQQDARSDSRRAETRSLKLSDQAAQNARSDSLFAERHPPDPPLGAGELREKYYGRIVEGNRGISAAQSGLDKQRDDSVDHTQQVFKDPEAAQALNQQRGQGLAMVRANSDSLAQLQHLEGLGESDPRGTMDLSDLFKRLIEQYNQYGLDGRGREAADAWLAPQLAGLVDPAILAKMDTSIEGLIRFVKKTNPEETGLEFP